MRHFLRLHTIQTNLYVRRINIHTNMSSPNIHNKNGIIYVRNKKRGTVKELSEGERERER